MNRIKLLLIEDNHLLRKGITAILNKTQDIEILSASGIKTIFGRIYHLGPKIILLDMGLRSQNSLRMTARVSKKFPDVKIIVMDLSPDKDDIIEFAEAGAVGFVMKDAPPGELIKTIRKVAAGEKVYSALLTESLLFQIGEHLLKSGESGFRELLRFTGPELAVVKLVSEGASNRVIAETLGIQSDSVISHIHNVMEKLALHARF